MWWLQTARILSVTIPSLAPASRCARPVDNRAGESGHDGPAARAGRIQPSGTANPWGCQHGFIIRLAPAAGQSPLAHRRGARQRWGAVVSHFPASDESTDRLASICRATRFCRNSRACGRRRRGRPPPPHRLFFPLQTIGNPGNLEESSKVSVATATLVRPLFVQPRPHRPTVRASTGTQPHAAHPSDPSWRSWPSPCSRPPPAPRNRSAWPARRTSLPTANSSLSATSATSGWSRPSAARPAR